jgi:hypothetical protein
LIEVPSFDNKVESCHDGTLRVVDKDGKIITIQKVDKFIEIELNKANKSGRVCFVQVAREPGFSKIVGIKIEESQTA